jgi:hypothetical protein
VASTEAIEVIMPKMVRHIVLNTLSSDSSLVKGLTFEQHNKLMLALADLALLNPTTAQSRLLDLFTLVQEIGNKAFMEALVDDD